MITFSQFSAHPLQDRQYAICHTFIIRRLFLLPCGLQFTRPRIHCYISPYAVYNVYGFGIHLHAINLTLFTQNAAEHEELNWSPCSSNMHCRWDWRPTTFHWPLVDRVSHCHKWVSGVFFGQTLYFRSKWFLSAYILWKKFGVISSKNF